MKPTPCLLAATTLLAFGGLLPTLSAADEPVSNKASQSAEAAKSVRLTIVTAQGGG